MMSKAEQKFKAKENKAKGNQAKKMSCYERRRRKKKKEEDENWE